MTVTTPQGRYADSFRMTTIGRRPVRSNRPPEFSKAKLRCTHELAPRYLKFLRRHLHKPLSTDVRSPYIWVAGLRTGYGNKRPV